jgi:phospholipid N-methyltransferase
MSNNNEVYLDENLTIMAKSSNFIDWLYDEIKPYLCGTILEVGSGIGIYSRKIVSNFKMNTIILSDVNPIYVNNLKKTFSDTPNINVIKLDLERKSDYKHLKNINSVIALNVLEHVHNDVASLNYIYNILSYKGKLIIIVPANKFLYNSIDKSVGHYRRYNIKDLKTKILMTKFKPKEIHYLNFISIFGWYLNGNIFKKKIVNEHAMQIFNQLVPFLRTFEKYILRKKIGISLLVVLEK